MTDIVVHGCPCDAPRNQVPLFVWITNVLESTSAIRR